MKEITKHVLGVVIILCVSGCIETNVITEPNGGEIYPDNPKNAPAETKEDKIFKVGETATDGRINITINNVRYADKIDELDSEWRVVNASDGKKYLIADVTIENLQPKRLSMGMFNSKVYSEEGYVSDQESGIQLNFLANPLPWGDDAYILPHSKVRGDVPYEISDEATGVKIVYTFTDYETSNDWDNWYNWVVTFEL